MSDAHADGHVSPDPDHQALGPSVTPVISGDGGNGGVGPGGGGGGGDGDGLPLTSPDLHTPGAYGDGTSGSPGFALSMQHVAFTSQHVPPPTHVLVGCGKLKLYATQGASAQHSATHAASVALAPSNGTDA